VLPSALQTPSYSVPIVNTTGSEAVEENATTNFASSTTESHAPPRALQESGLEEDWIYSPALVNEAGWEAVHSFRHARYL
jgi:hypothetical protein